MAQDKLSIGVDIGGSKVLGLAVGPEGEIHGRGDRVTPHRSMEPLVVENVIVDVVQSLASQHRVVAVGIGAAGFVDRSRERVMFAPHLSWRDEPLGVHLSERLGQPVVIDNDANAALWAEHRFGAARGTDDALMITLGTGIGGALMIGGSIHRGHNGMAGEFGHMQVVPDGRPCECGRTGCWEQYCSGKALARFAREAGFDREGAELTAAAAASDPVALGAFAEVARWLGVGAANVVAALDPSAVLIGGGLSAAGEVLLEPARKALAEAIVGRGFRDVPVLVPAMLGPLAGAIGAADLARQSQAAEEDD